VRKFKIENTNKQKNTNRDRIVLLIIVFSKTGGIAVTGREEWLWGAVKFGRAAVNGGKSAAWSKIVCFGDAVYGMW